MADEHRPRSPAVAAAAILVFSGIGLLLMPQIVLWFGAFSPWLGLAAGSLIILSFFGVFWLRAIVQRRRERR